MSLIVSGENITSYILANCRCSPDNGHLHLDPSMGGCWRTRMVFVPLLKLTPTFTLPNRAVCREPSAFFLRLWYFMSVRARAGWLTNIPLITLQQSTNPHTQTARWTDGLRHTCTLCLTLISGLSTMPSPVLTGLYKCPKVRKSHCLYSLTDCVQVEYSHKQRHTWVRLQKCSQILVHLCRCGPSCNIWLIMNIVNDRHTCRVTPHYADSSRLACQNLFFTFFI